MEVYESLVVNFKRNCGKSPVAVTDTLAKILYMFQCINCIMSIKFVGKISCFLNDENRKIMIGRITKNALVLLQRFPTQKICSKISAFNAGEK